MLQALGLPQNQTHENDSPVLSRRNPGVKHRKLPAQPGDFAKTLTPALKTGDYVWAPEVSSQGPVVLIVSLSEQLLYVYRNGVRIERSTISSGKPGHRTPTGIFTILQKNVKHVSTIYKGASMPYMERLTWGGVAIHAGNLPGFPAACGCPWNLPSCSTQ